MMYPCLDALGSRLGCVLQRNTEGDPNTCRRLFRQNNRNPSTTNYRVGSNGLLINTLLVIPPPMHSETRVTLGCTPGQLPTNGCKDRKLGPLSSKKPNGVWPMLASAKSPSSSKCTPSHLLIHARWRTRTATPSRFTFWMKPQQQLFQPLRSRKSRATERLASATNTSSGTR